MAKLYQSTSKEFKIKRFHSDEIRLILFICATDLKKYDYKDLKIFAECIQGRIEVLLTPEYLKSISGFIRIDNFSMNKIQDLKIMLQKQYSSQWYKKTTNPDWKEIFSISQEILKQLNIEYQEPLTFLQNNLEVDWT